MGELSHLVSSEVVGRSVEQVPITDNDIRSLM